MKVLLAGLLALVAAAPAHAATVDALTLETRPLAPGQFELLTRSTAPRMVSDGQVLAEVRGLADGTVPRVRAGKRTVPFPAATDGVSRALVRGLKLGPTLLRASVGRRTARLRVVNHRLAGPIISGPHQTPFYCETERNGLGPPRNADCMAPTQVAWYYRSTTSQNFAKLDDPYAAYPSDTDTTTTADGTRVPFVVRIESGTINRSISRIAVLDDPHARGRDPRFEPALWNRRLTYAFGESCGVGYGQGRSSVGNVLGAPPDGIGADNIFATVYGLTDRLGAGDIVAHSTLTTHGVHCNPVLSAETLAMMKERLVERYGIPKRTVGVGGSGGALQQYSAANTYPGLLNAATPIASFTDIASTAMTVVDCGLLLHYWESTGLEYSDEQKKAIAGHRTTSICNSWRETFLPILHPFEGCPGIVPDETRWSDTNPDGVRCTLPDALVNLTGVDKATGWARRPYDNVGVQYGLGALNAGAITPTQFIDLNRNIGGFDLNSRHIPQRSAMAPALARRWYRFGLVVGRGALSRIPIIDLATYLDLIPIADIHDDVRPFQQRARVEGRLAKGTMAIWRGVSLPSDVQPALTQWLDNIDAAGAQGDPAGIAAARPAAADDRCIITAAGTSVEPFNEITGPLGIVRLPLGGPSTGQIWIGMNVPERQEASGNGLCQSVFTAVGEPRMVAGGPLSDDVIKCALKPVDPADYAAGLTEPEHAELRAIFPGGVCDWTRPGVGEVARSQTWPSVGGRRLRKPFSVRWTVARSG